MACSCWQSLLLEKQHSLRQPEYLATRGAKMRLTIVMASQSGQPTLKDVEHKIHTMLTMSTRTPPNRL